MAPSTVFRAGSQPSTIHFWLMQHPGYHSPTEVAEALGYTTHQAAVALRALLDRGLVDRQARQYAVVPYNRRS